MLELSGLNAPQREAVLHTEGPLVVFAGAGSGKTRVITYRIAHMIETLGVSPSSVLAVTFTNKAAAEMRERLVKLVGARARALEVGTFHATCAKLLRRNAERIGISKDFTIYDDQDQQAMLKRIMRELDIDEKRVPVRAISGAIDKAKNELVYAEDLPARDPVSYSIREVFIEYEKRMRAANALDFGDLMVVLVRAIESDDVLRAALTERYRYILVDEFQDTNHVQLRLVRALAGASRNVCVVGDDDQSIYRWRGADRRNILDFQKSFAGAHVVKLEQNYRSTARILRVAHEVIKRNVEREPKQMWTDNDDGPPIVVVATEDERDEARLVARGIRELVANGTRASEIAVFYRTHAQSRVLEEALRSANTPYRIVGGQRFFERAEVKDLLAYMRVLVNPADDVSFLRIVNVPIRGIGKTTVDKISARASRVGISVYEAFTDATEPELGRAKTGARALTSMLAEQRAAMFRGESIAVVASTLLERTGYVEKLHAEDTAEADARAENLQELIGSMAEYEAEEEDTTLAGFLERVTLDQEKEGDVAVEKVTLMTVHAAKGLEFDVVMMTGLEEGLFPYQRWNQTRSREDEEEERRLAYVAFTRARERLVLSNARYRRIHAKADYTTPSRFLDELPFEDVEWVGGARPKRPVAKPAWSSPDFVPTEPLRAAAKAAAATEARLARSVASGAQAVRAQRSESWIDTSDGDVGVGQALRRGSRVQHPKFGVGLVRSVMPGVPAKVVVAFEAIGEKTVVATYLEPLFG